MGGRSAMACRRSSSLNTYGNNLITFSCWPLSGSFWGLLCFECQLAIAPDQQRRAFAPVGGDGQSALKAKVNGRHPSLANRNSRSAVDSNMVKPFSVNRPCLRRRR